MNKILLIISREYLTRVRKKSFIIMTLLSPLLFAAMIVVPTWLNSQEDTKEKVIAIEDHTGLYANTFEDSKYIKYESLTSSGSIEKQKIIRNGYDALLVINNDLLQKPSDIQLYSDGQITMDIQDNINHQLNTYLKDQKLKSFQIEGLNEKIKEINGFHVNIQTIRLDKDGEEKEGNAVLAMIIGMVSALMIYMFMLMYGTQVMKGVIEEKSSRIVEVIISSVKPFQLMMGKIIGIGLVALTQFLLWIILTLGVTGITQGIARSNDKGTQPKEISITQHIEDGQNHIIEDSTNNSKPDDTMSKVMDLIFDARMLTTVAFFIFYFIGGYLVYSALFAAIGSAIDNETETQQFVMPILIPLILSIYVAMAVFKNPHGDIAFWFSMIPLTSPVVMMSRLPFDVPTWELLLSMFILTASFVFLTWFAGRVYRTGILMYGKKVNYKEIWKWFIQSGK